MKLKEFTPENCVERKGTGAAVSIQFKKGLFSINRKANELMGLSVGDEVILLQDEEEPENWYLQKVSAGKGFPLTKKTAVGYTFFQNVAVARTISEQFNFSGKGAKILVAGKPTAVEDRTLWGLLMIGINNQ